MSEADKIIKNLKNSGKKVEEFYVSNKTSDKNVGSIEEDIRILQEKDCMWHYPETRIEEAIENIIADYTRQKEMNEEHQKINGELRERIQELEEQVKTLDEAYTGTIKESKKWFDIAHNSIPKQVVIDKIKEYDKKMEEDAGHPNWVITDRIVMNVLQELLEGERK